MEDDFSLKLAPVMGCPVYQHPTLCLSGQRLGDGLALGVLFVGMIVGGWELWTVSVALLDEKDCH